MKIYTKTGDQGETSLYGGQRVRKDHARMAVVGAFDELNASIGAVRAESKRGGGPPTEWAVGLDRLLHKVQHRLFDLGAEVATPKTNLLQEQLLQPAQVVELEHAIDQNEARLEPLKNFVLPGGTTTAAQLHLARCVCRRAERRLVSLAADQDIRSVVLQYLNRLSDLLFVLARAANHDSGEPDVVWEKLADS